MKKIGVILIDVLYWMVVTSLITTLLLFSDYALDDALFVALMFMPGCMILKFVLPQLSFRNRREGLINLFYILCAVVLTVILLMLISHSRMYYTGSYIHRYQMPGFLTNPLSIVLIISAAAAGDHLLMKCLCPRRTPSDNPLTFTSDYKKITLNISDILYVESRDTEVWIYATDDRHFRNKTGITQWQNLLGEDFLRVHRSYLVNRDAVSSVSDGNIVLSDGSSIPVSRKYRDVLQIL